MPGDMTALPEEKRRRIVEASLEEFVARGFEGASTNAIAKRAHVAKGLLFHYFANKKGLYLYLVDQATEELMQRFYQLVDAESASSDFFEKMVAWSTHKLQLFRSNPLLYQFVTAAFANPPDELSREIAARRERLDVEGRPRFLEGTGTSRLRSDVTAEQAIEIVTLFLDGLERKYMAQLAALPDRGLEQLDGPFDEMQHYLRVLRDGLYLQGKD